MHSKVPQELGPPPSFLGIKQYTAENVPEEIRIRLKKLYNQRRWIACAVCDKRHFQAPLKRCSGCGDNLKGLRVYYCVSAVLGRL